MIENVYRNLYPDNHAASAGQLSLPLRAHRSSPLNHHFHMIWHDSDIWQVRFGGKVLETMTGQIRK